MAEERLTGVVQWFNDSKGFGFIKPDNEGEDLFVHQSSIKSDGYRSLEEGERVEFLIAVGDNEKTKAVDVTGPNGASLQPTKKDSYGSGGGSARGGGGYGSRGGWRGGDRRNNAGGGSCYQCGDFGHFSRDCSRGSNTSGGGNASCFKCGGFGHMARDCDKRSGGGSGGNCFNCGKVGHLARDCVKESRRTGVAATGSTCFNCGENGHFARECPIIS